MKTTRFITGMFLLGAILLQTAFPAGTVPPPREAFYRRFIADFPRHPLDTQPSHAALLKMLIQIKGARRGVEVGSAHGFGAVHMGIALERTGGRLTTIEIDPQRAARCRETLLRIGLERTVTCIGGDALEVLPELEGPFDFVFLDAKNEDTLKYLLCLEPKLQPGAVIVANCAVASARAMQDYFDYLEKHPDYETVTVTTAAAGSTGLSIALKVR